MDSQELRSLQEAYLDIYTEARDGYGDDTKFKQDTDADDFIPGKSVPKVKKYGRISRYSPMGGQRSRTSSEVTKTVGDDPGAPRAVKIHKGPKMVKKDGKWVKEAYDIVLEYLLDEGYADTVENAEAIMVNMSVDWLGSIVEGYEEV
jgi:hypothetical protein